MAELSSLWGVWRLVRRGGGEVVCWVDVLEADFPWLVGQVRAGPAFDGVAPLFARVRELADRGEEWSEVYARIEAEVELVSPEGPVAEFLLHLDGGRAWFRFGEEPFED
ncbi:hypothetical protein KCV87_02790 [Actinosynnema pretiosum subsp. pretiosum]|uniref:Uncharacterized protein n=1 Tax=Actinosynnema pretiosum subsp. pretiosum TaxID=103721 RepID=A0AA45L837_9PSEU|nr:hypothetical protein APASM_3457 [Actinosynnema pretiosum subsp. pretiosum]QUF05066.1 hypothetical protein KCV87_02790 [Actinosynnema pretiosum subsp. pretiosum]